MWHCVLTRFCNRTGGVSTRLCQVTRHRAGLCFTLASFILKLKCYSSKQVPCNETQNFYKCHSSVEFYRLSIVYWCGCENLSIRSIAIAITSYTIIDIWHAYVLTSHGWVITYHTFINVIIYVLVEAEMSQKLSWRDLFVQIVLGVDIASLGIK